VYAVSKLASEHFAHCYQEEHGLSVTSVRPFNVYGPRQIGEGAVQPMVRRALRGEDITVFNEGTQIRSWCYVGDFVDGLMSALFRDGVASEVFNLGNPQATITVLGLAQTIVRMTGSRSRIVFKPHPGPEIEMRVPDISKARRHLGAPLGIDGHDVNIVGKLAVGEFDDVEAGRDLEALREQGGRHSNEAEACNCNRPHGPHQRGRSAVARRRANATRRVVAPAHVRGALLGERTGALPGVPRRQHRGGDLGLPVELLVGGRNPLVLATGLGSTAVLVGIIQTPGLSQFFGCTPLDPLAWATVAGCAGGTTVLAAIADQHGPKTSLLDAVLFPDFQSVLFQALEQRRQPAGNAGVDALFVDHGFLSLFVIPGPSQRVRPEVAGPMTSSARSPESITTVRDYGFRTCRCAAIRNDVITPAGSAPPPLR